MPDVTRLLEAAATGDTQAAADLLPHVYEELRRLAAARLAAEKPGQTLQATALVHEAYMRLVGSDSNSTQQNWNGRGHFFGAAAEAMRRILVENARRKGRLRHGGGRRKIDLDAAQAAVPKPDDDLVALSEALDHLAAANDKAAEVVKLRYFAGLSNREAAEALDISSRKANQLWAYARAWLLDRLADSSD